MKPSVEQMLEAMQLALREKVSPVVSDQWAASALRSVDVILNHLQARTPVEGPMLYEDNRDLAAVLEGAGGLSLAGEMASNGDVLAKALAGFAADVAESAQGYPAVAVLSALNVRGRYLLDDLLRVCHARRGQPGVERVHTALRGYLDRHIERERPFFFPTYVGRPV
ncbi:hypothetical protein GCM10010909_03690 [Acidocella aquatica]|uniref:Hemerythrin-like domain-containing protein n=1 Tax=Acidocella aquatica TaxID=1922313 RepID=A0ABQ5ZZP9_9PROT|nr:hypothetical protein [Acidocella aquatica]GLR65691.1 hypothetical protein GCM10010909_03690 [Acidocella aquatica]